MGTTLQQHARSIRRGIISAVAAASSGHPGGSLSAVEIVTTLFFQEMNIYPEQPNWPHRDRFVLCKGHAAPLLYAALAKRGFFPWDELTTLRQLGARLQGHPDMRKIPGVDMSTGSLGQGLSTALGMALALRLQQKDSYVYALLGDGELQEGQVWEAAMAAGHYKVNHLIGIIDNNGLQIDGPISEVLNPMPLVEKWEAFGWNVIEVDGHDIDALSAAFRSARNEQTKPTMIIASTVKGKGVSFMENRAEWHGSAPSAEQTAAALQELQDPENEGGEAHV